MLDEKDVETIRNIVKEEVNGAVKELLLTTIAVVGVELREIVEKERKYAEEHKLTDKVATCDKILERLDAMEKPF